MKTPKVIISGITGSGKSTLAFALKHVLTKYGINVIITGSEDEPSFLMESEWESRIENLRGKNVTIKTVREK